MHQGKHQEYEKRLHDALIAQTASSNNPSSNNGKSDDNKSPSDIQSESPVQNKDAWPCLSVSPDSKDNKSSSKTNKENSKKSKGEKSKCKKANCAQNYSSNGKDGEFNINIESSEKRNELIDQQKQTMSADEELNLISEIENEELLTDNDGKTDTPSLRYIRYI